MLDLDWGVCVCVVLQLVYIYIYSKNTFSQDLVSFGAL